ncbi:hypothetical protein J6590_072667 [Homalodisca vitripennis]|nr:hypothetical protein J6590_072667 [Homalodisca vitripennis]
MCIDKKTGTLRRPNLKSSCNLSGQVLSSAVKLGTGAVLPHRAQSQHFPPEPLIPNLICCDRCLLITDNRKQNRSNLRSLISCCSGFVQGTTSSSWVTHETSFSCSRRMGRSSQAERKSGDGGAPPANYR